MTMKIAAHIGRVLFTSAAVFAATALAQAQTAPATVVESGAALPPAAQQAVEQMLAKGTTGVTVIFANRAGEISRNHAGKIDADTQYPIASASKWVTAAVVMTLVDEGKLSLDKPVSTWLRDVRGEAGTATLRQLLAQTSGVAGTLPDLYDLKQDHRLTLAQSADEILGRPMAHRPGSEFHYGGPGFQVVGAVVEATTGQRWEEVFQDRIARPLGMKNSFWMHLKLGEITPPVAETRNPILQGGMVSTADDYVRFLKMLNQKGRYAGRRILSANAVAEMMTDQTRDAKMNQTGAVVLRDAHYSLGNWCEIWDRKGRCTRSSSLGAFATYPWLDLPSGQYGLIFMNRQQDSFAVWPEIQTIQSALTQTVERRKK
jgi:CubicO group peptidase (beta-lactamase class C family)